MDVYLFCGDKITMPVHLGYIDFVVSLMHKSKELLLLHMSLIGSIVDFIVDTNCTTIHEVHGTLQHFVPCQAHNVPVQLFNKSNFKSNM